MTNRQMLDKICKFKVGDTVKHKLMLDVSVQEKPYVSISDSRIAKFYIIERLIQECYGGIQIQYKTRPITAIFAFGEREFVVFTEPEIEKV